ncbi:hypothetical protein BDV40DRAFT_267763 [Aspergillus tamarii]|uniref:Uncharacterized protein n=1 Tax=Aspergillus tamarii TaxID=41984 RepID=A0A5N6UU00_ASPTM|nr:hypothetical protein BDV40DRAFT_267763 [Aspergillus tamarii]
MRRKTPPNLHCILHRRHNIDHSRRDSSPMSQLRQCICRKWRLARTLLIGRLTLTSGTMSAMVVYSRRWRA